MAGKEGKVVGGDTHAQSVVAQVEQELKAQGLMPGQGVADGPGVVRFRRNVQFPPARRPVNADVVAEYDSKTVEDGKHRLRVKTMTPESEKKFPQEDEIRDPVTGKPRQHVRYISARTGNIIVRN